MKKIIDFVKSSTRQLVEIVALLAVMVIPWFIPLHELFEDYLTSNSLSPENIWWYVALSQGKPIASLILFALLLVPIRKNNVDFVMNGRYLYHDYCYAWYWFCAKVLGIKKCNLILVPIHMQFKLAIRGTFCEYPMNDNDYPVVENEPDCSVSLIHQDETSKIINLVLEDTYPIMENQIRSQNRKKYTIKVSRNNGCSGRHFSPKFVDATLNMLNGYNRIQIANVYATTNPKNTLYIARQVFGKVDRGNIEHLYVFQQMSNGKRMFEAKGDKIF